MPIHIVASSISQILPSQYYFQLAVGLIGLTFVRAWASGPSNTRERKLHGRTVLLTGGFTPTGLVILSRLAESGAQVIALTPSLSDILPLELIPVLRTTTSNELIFAEECDLSSPASIRQFCSNFVRSTGTGVSADPPRLDAIIFAHEYGHTGMFGAPRVVKEVERAARLEASNATFLMTTLLLPFLLRSPADRDIRIINLVNPFYAASVPAFAPTTNPPADSPPSPTPAPTPSSSIWKNEGDRSLRSIIFARHLQRVLDALIVPSAPIPTPKPDGDIASIPKKSSNIISLAVCPGFSRSDTISPFLRSSIHTGYRTILGSILYIILLPILLLLSKSAFAASQSVLYTLALPPSQKQTDKGDKTVEGGQLYRDCAIVSMPGKGNALLGDETIGRHVWEEYEKNIAEWEKEHKQREEDESAKKTKSPPAPEVQPNEEAGSTGKGKEKAS